MNGIDVSEHQGIIRWNEVKTDFCIIRAGYGKYAHQKDKFFEANYKGCKENNIPCGAYWYSYAQSEEEARQEAEVFLQILGGKQFDMPVYFDVEEAMQLRKGKQFVSNIIRTFLETVESKGYWVGLYMSASPLADYVEDEIKERYAVWVAHYGVEKPSAKVYGMWQTGSTGRINGIVGNVDTNIAYVHYHNLIPERGLNGYPKYIEPVKEEEDLIPFSIELNGIKYSGKLRRE